MAMYKKTSDRSLATGKSGTPGSGPPLTTPGNTRAFDMRPKPINDPRHSAVRSVAAAPEPLLDPDPAE